MSFSKQTSLEDQNKEQKKLAKKLKNSSYMKIISKFPTYLNGKVKQSFLEFGSLSLPNLLEGRILLKMTKIKIDDSIYLGEVNEKFERDGFGCLVKKDGSLYEGYFSEGQFEGQGRLINAEGNVYSGNWQVNMLQGEGMYLIKKPYVSYTGNLKDTQASGKGRQVFHDNSSYEGEFVSGKRQGTGIYYLPDGSRYEGEFYRDKQYGKGIFFYKDGSRIEGTWDKGNIIGQGVKTWQDGKKYTGEFNGSLCEGKGIMEWPDGRIFDGFWLTDRPHGIGTEIKKNGKKIEATWRAGKITSVIAEYPAPEGHKKKSEISETVRDLEEKAQEYRKRLNKEYSEQEYLSVIRSYNLSEKDKDEKNRKEKIKRYNEKMEAKILEAAKNWAKGREVVRIQGFFEDCLRIGKILNDFSEDLPQRFSKILDIRGGKPDFNYYEPDMRIEPDLTMIENWFQIDIETYYKGELLDHKPEGRGVLIKPSELYEGYFQRGDKHGIGRLSCLNKQYIGYFHKNHPSGFGTLTKKSSVYSGEFEFGKETGFGVLISKLGRYEGQWKLGKQHGKGILKYEDGRIYKGDFCEGSIKGYGSIIWKSGKSIMGYWDDGEIVGDPEKVYLPSEQIPVVPDEELDIIYYEKSQGELNEISNQAEEKSENSV